MTPTEITQGIVERCARPGAPGLAVAVLRGPDVVYRATAGLASLEHDVPIGPRTGFRIGSVSKHFAVAVALMLAREGRLDIEAPVRTYLPELPAYPVAPTVRQLMNNTAGIGDFLELLTASGAGVFRPVPWPVSCELVLRQQHLNCVPGEEFIYSAGGFLLLCMLIERIAGRPMEEILEARIFGPLGMANSRLVRNDSTVVRDVAWPYIEPEPGRFVRGGWGIEANCEGAIIATLDDMALWMAELSRPRVLGQDLLAAMTTPLTYANGATGRYGLGLYVESFRGWTVFGHGGRMPGLKAEVARYPEADLSIVVLTNLFGIEPYALGREIAAAWLPDRGQRETEAPEPPLDALAGRFLEPESRDLIEITAVDGRPWLATSSAPLRLHRAEDGAFLPESPILDLRLRPAEGGLDVVSCGRARHYARIGPAPAYRAADYVGNFFSADLAATYRIRPAADGRLTLRMQGELGHFDTVLDCLAEDMFRASPADPRTSWNQPLLHFVRDEAGRVEGLLYSTDRTRRMRFARLPEVLP